MRTKLLLVSAATLILLLALLNVVAEHLHWRRGTFDVNSPRHILEQRDAGARSGGTAQPPQPQPQRTAEGK